MKKTILLAILLMIWSAAQVSAAPFTNNGNGTVTDSGTGLMWQQAEGGSMTWDNALSYCEGLSLGGYSDWRLPNIKELESLTDDSRYNPAIDRNFFPNAYASYYWSSTTYAYYPYGAWYVYFYGGNVYYGSKGYYGFYVRCARGGQGCLFDNLSGKVLDATTGSPLSGITVTVDGTFTDISDSGGNYSFTGLSTSSHTATVNVPGFVYYSSSVCGTTRNILLTKNSAVYGSQTNSGYSKDPVNTATGNYIYNKKDQQMPGKGMNFIFERNYNSQDPSDGPLGYGCRVEQWRSGFRLSLSVSTVSSFVPV